MKILCRRVGEGKELRDSSDARMLLRGRERTEFPAIFDVASASSVNPFENFKYARVFMFAHGECDPAKREK